MLIDPVLETKGFVAEMARIFSRFVDIAILAGTDHHLVFARSNTFTDVSSPIYVRRWFFNALRSYISGTTPAITFLYSIAPYAPHLNTTPREDQVPSAIPRPMI